jgi:hypothetical protein
LNRLWRNLPIANRLWKKSSPAVQLIVLGK